MNDLSRKVVRFLLDENGPTTVEYAMLLFLCILVAMSAISIFGQVTGGSFENSGGQIDAVIQ